MAIIFLLLSLYYIDQPFLDVPDHGEFSLQLRFGPGGEILGFFDVGVLDRFGFGISYGASNLIGAGDPDFYEIPGVQIKVVVIEQGFAAPEVIFGFDNQGYGPYSEPRYYTMSKGLYGQIGKTFAMSNVEFVPSLGVNYCFEGDNRFDMFTGLQIQFGSSSALVFDYSPNFNDDLDQNKGNMNVGLKFIFYDELFFEFALRDLFDNGHSEADQQFNRMIRLGYKQMF